MRETVVLMLFAAPATAQLWWGSVSGGGCQASYRCVNSRNYPSSHGNDESCTISINQDVSVTVGSPFGVEPCCDNLVINSLDIESRDSVPATLWAGSRITWNTDYSVTNAGWRLCFYTTGRPPPPPYWWRPPPPSPLPPPYWWRPPPPPYWHDDDDDDGYFTGYDDDDEGPACAGHPCWVDQLSFSLFVSWVILLGLCFLACCGPVLLGDNLRRSEKICEFAFGFASMAFVGFLNTVVAWRVVIAIDDGKLDELWGIIIIAITGCLTVAILFGCWGQHAIAKRDEKYGSWDDLNRYTWRELENDDTSTAFGFTLTAKRFTAEGGRKYDVDLIRTNIIKCCSRLPDDYDRDGVEIHLKNTTYGEDDTMALRISIKVRVPSALSLDEVAADFEGHSGLSADDAGTISLASVSKALGVCVDSETGVHMDVEGIVHVEKYPPGAPCGGEWTTWSDFEAGDCITWLGACICGLPCLLIGCINIVQPEGSTRKVYAAPDGRWFHPNGSLAEPGARRGPANQGEMQRVTILIPKESASVAFGIGAFQPSRGADVVVRSLTPGGLCDTSGVRVGDIVVNVNGFQGRTARDVIELLKRAPIGTIKLMVLRDQIGADPIASSTREPLPLHGIALVEPSPNVPPPAADVALPVASASCAPSQRLSTVFTVTLAKGVAGFGMDLTSDNVVRAILPASEAADCGLIQPGDRVMHINGNAVSVDKPVKSFAIDLPNGAAATFSLVRNADRNSMVDIPVVEGAVPVGLPVPVPVELAKATTRASQSL